MDNTTERKIIPAIPVLTLGNIVVYPNVAMHFDVKRPKAILAIKAALDLNKKIFVVTQNTLNTEDPSMDDLYKIGVVCSIKQILKTDDDTIRVLIEGETKAEINDLITMEPYYLATVTTLEYVKKSRLSKIEEKAVVRLVKKAYNDYCYILPNASRDMVANAIAKKNPHNLFASIAPNLMISVEERQSLLETDNIFDTLMLLVQVLTNELGILNIEHDLYEKVRERIDKNQRDYFLREQQQVISQELGDFGDVSEEADDFAYKITYTKNMEQKTKDKLLKECERLRRTSTQSQEGNVIRSYLEVCTDLPFDTSSDDTLDIAKAQKQLDTDHFGMEKVKERILEVLSVRKIKPDVKGQIICLVGPPGVGKTSIAKSIATALNREYSRIALGGVSDESEIRGHRKTYLGSMPGRVIQAFRQVQVNNPLILFDEIDKMTSNMRGDPSAAMLEVLDPEQNVEFTDHYTEIPFDLSKTIFVTTANTTSTIPQPLLDRMEIIEISSYTREEKFNITKKYLIKKQLEKHGLTTKQLTFRDAGIYEVIDGYTKEAGVRNLERKIASICRKTAKLIVSDEKEKVIVTAKNVSDFLDTRKYKKKEQVQKDKVGIVNGLAWTSVGGEMLEIESAIMEGTGQVRVTGSLGDVMKESAQLAVSYVRTIAKDYKIKPNFYRECDIHIHAPEGATPKDGPSAGVTMVTSLVSSLTNLPVRNDVAMTGEISLRGRVMPIGGLKEKSMAAYQEGKKIVLIPKENEPDLSEVSKVVLESIEFIPVEEISEVLDVALSKELDLGVASEWCVGNDVGGIGF